MNKPFDKLRVGDTVYVISNFGKGPVVKGVVTQVDKSLPGIDYKLPSGATHWAYQHQIVEKA